VSQFSVPRSRGEGAGFSEVQTSLRTEVRPPLLFIFLAKKETSWSSLEVRRSLGQDISRFCMYPELKLCHSSLYPGTIRRQLVYRSMDTQDMLRGKHRKTSHLASPEARSPTTASPGYPNTPEKQELD